jgi:hypothetical protein
MVLLALALGASSAGAAELDYRAPEGCPSRDELIFRIERGLGRALARAPAARFDAEVHAAGSGYAGTLQLSEAAAGPERQRLLSARSCSELVDAPHRHNANAGQQRHRALDASGVTGVSSLARVA